MDTPAPLHRAAATPLRFHYTLGDLERLARYAARYRARWTTVVLSAYERYELAWSAIAEELYARPAHHPPTAEELINIAGEAIRKHAVADLDGRGLYAATTKGQDGHKPRFHTYWHTTVRPTPSPEEQIIEPLALRQIWSCLTPSNRHVLLTVARCETRQAAAQALGVSLDRLNNLLYRARRRFLRLWHEHEQPSRIWSPDMPLRSTSPRAEQARRTRAITALRRRAKNRRTRTTHSNEDTDAHP